MFGKTIRLFLLEGNTNGMITAELSNWTGKAFKIPRIKIKEYSNRAELKSPGIYLLLGKNEKNEESVYVGEGEPVIDRIVSHLAGKEFWNEVIIFVSKDKYLNKASIKYLENRLHQNAVDAERYDVENSNIPTLSGVSEAEQAELEEFMSNVKLLTSTLGHKVFEQLQETIDKEPTTPSIFYCKNGVGANSTGSPSTEGFIVYKGSLFTNIVNPSLSESIRNEKQRMITDGILTFQNELLLLQKHYTFNSSSRAAAMILGRSASGPLEWKTEAGVQLKTFESAQL
jgi:hypothetical protein